MQAVQAYPVLASSRDAEGLEQLLTTVGASSSPCPFKTMIFYKKTLLGPPRYSVSVEAVAIEGKSDFFQRWHRQNVYVVVWLR